MKLITSIWFDKIGIVVGENEMGVWKTYMRHVGQTFDKKTDEQYVLDYGYKIPVEAACGFFPEIAEDLRAKQERR